mgnify:CR=1 FL=1
MHNDRMFEWSDLRHLIAVPRCGSTPAAAKELGVTPSTVHRRRAEIEGAAGLCVVERQPAGCRLTELGEALIEDLLAVGTAGEAPQRRIAAMKRDLSGTPRTAAFAIACRVYPGAAAGAGGVGPARGGVSFASDRRRRPARLILVMAELRQFAMKPGIRVDIS